MKTLLFILAFASPVWAAINAASVWEIRSTAEANNGGCWWNSGGSSTDYSQQDAAQLTLTDVTSNAAGTAWASVTGGFTANMVGSCVRLSSGTNFTVGTYQITAFTDTNNVTVDRDSTSGASASAGNIKVGGALPDTWTVAPAYVAGNTIWIKAATYTRTSTLFALTVTGTPAAPVIIQGYTSTRGDSTGTAASWTGPIFTSATNSINLMTLNTANYTTIRNIKFTHTATTRGKALVSLTGTSVSVKIMNNVFDGFLTSVDTLGVDFTPCFLFNNTFVNGCVTTGTCGTTAHQVNISNAQITYAQGNIFYNNTGTAMKQAGSGTWQLFATHNVFAANIRGIESTHASATNTYYLENNSFDGNTTMGLSDAATSTPARLLLMNNIFWTTGISLSFTSPGTDPRSVVFNNALGNGATYSGLTAGVNDVALTGTPFTSSTNWALNNTAGAGASCRAAAFPGTMQDGVTIGYQDIGAVQHQDSGGAAVTRAFPFVM